MQRSEDLAVIIPEVTEFTLIEDEQELFIPEPRRNSPKILTEIRSESRVAQCI